MIVDTHGQNGHESVSIKKEIPIPTMITPAVSITTRLMNQMKDLSVSSTIPNVALASAIKSSTAYLDDYEITDFDIESPKKSISGIAAFPPRHSTAIDHHERDTPISSLSNDVGIRFGTTPGPQPPPSSSSTYEKSNLISSLSYFFYRHDDSWDFEKSQQYYLDPRFSDPAAASAE